MKILLPDGAQFTGDPIVEILKTSRTVAVVGLSSDPARPSHGVAQYLHGAGYRIVPVNPNEREVLGEKSYARLEDVPEKVEIVDVFRRSSQVAAIADSAIAVGAKVLWLQLGVFDEQAAAKAREAGLTVVSETCLMVEHRRRRSIL